MTILEKIKAEIDKLYGEYKDKFHQCGDQYHLGLIDGLDMAERVLDTLESEKPMQEDLNEEIKKFIDEYGYERGADKLLIAIVARHFAQWGAEHLADARKTSPKDLEDASDEYAEKHGFRVPYDGSDNFYDDVDVKASKEGFIAGAKWNREQMMKDGLDAVKSGQSNKIEKTIAGVFVDYGMRRQKEQLIKEAVEGEFILNPYPTICLDDCKDYNFKEEQKVSVIILPKED